MHYLASLVASTLLCAELCGCATSRQAASSDTLSSCLVGDDQLGWVYIEQPPANADDLRAVMVASISVSRFDLKYAEHWFSHTDGRLLRCTLHPQFGHGPCGASNYIFSKHDGSWKAEYGPTLLCIEKRK